MYVNLSEVDRGTTRRTLDLVAPSRKLYLEQLADLHAATVLGQHERVELPSFEFLVLSVTTTLDPKLMKTTSPKWAHLQHLGSLVWRISYDTSLEVFFMCQIKPVRAIQTALQENRI